MKIYFFTFVAFIVLPIVGHAQKVLVGCNERSTKLWIKYGFDKKDYDLTETDTCWTLTTHASYRQLVVHASFAKPGRKGICTAEKVSLDCDSCYQRLFKEALGWKRFHWTCVSTDRYLSKVSKKLLLAGSTAGHYFTLSLVDVSNDAYKKMLEARVH